MLRVWDQLKGLTTERLNYGEPSEKSQWRRLSFHIQYMVCVLSFVLRGGHMFWHCVTPGQFINHDVFLVLCWRPPCCPSINILHWAACDLGHVHQWIIFKIYRYLTIQCLKNSKNWTYSIWSITCITVTRITGLSQSKQNSLCTWLKSILQHNIYIKTGIWLIHFEHWLLRDS